MRDSFTPEYISPAQAAELAGVCYRTVMRAIWNHRLRARRVLAAGDGRGGNWRIRIEDFDAWMAGQRPAPLRRPA